MNYVKEGDWYVFKHQTYPGKKFKWCGNTFTEYHSWCYWDGTFYIRHERDALLFQLRWV